MAKAQRRDVDDFRKDIAAKTYAVHPAAAVFPEMSDDEIKELSKDIKAHGLLEAITIDKDKRVLDGRNRLAACKLVRVDPKFETFKGEDVAAFIIGKNIRRRHLTKTQQASLIVATIKAAQPDAKREIGGRKGGSKKDTVKEKAVGEAKKHGISKRTVEKALRDPDKPKRKRKSLIPKIEDKALAASIGERDAQDHMDAAQVKEKVEAAFKDFPELPAALDRRSQFTVVNGEPLKVATIRVLTNLLALGGATKIWGAIEDDHEARDLIQRAWTLLVDLHSRMS